MDALAHSIEALEAEILRETQSDPGLHVAKAATAALRNCDLTAYSPTDILEHAVSAELPRQAWTNDFGEPAVTVANNRLFRIDILFWSHPISPRHGHVSCGSFMPLYGRRAHTTYAFERRAGYGDLIQTGRLVRETQELLSSGDAVEIQPDLIHELHWIDQPSVTLSVRCNNHAAAASRPWEYYLPGLAVIDMTLQESAEVKRQLDAIRLLRHLNTGQFDAVLRDVVSTPGNESLAYHLAVDIATTNWGAAHVEALIHHLSVRENDFGDTLVAALPEMRQRALLNRVTSVSGEEYLAVLDGVTGSRLSSGTTLPQNGRMSRVHSLVASIREQVDGIAAGSAEREGESHVGERATH